MSSPSNAPRTTGSNARLAACVGVFLVLLGVVFGRLVQLEAKDGRTCRDLASKPLTQRRDVKGTRGRIVARDGTVLARDETVRALSVRYRYLQDPPDPAWLRSMARARLSTAQRRDPAEVAQAEADVQLECQVARHRLAKLCGLSVNEWTRRASRITTEVEQIADEVNRRRQAEHDRRRQNLHRTRWDRLFDTPDAPPPTETTVREELDYHVMVPDVSPEAEMEILAHPDRYPGVRIEDHARRVYPGKTLACHVLGHLGLIDQGELEADAGGRYRDGDRRGRAGLELQYESALHGRWGKVVESTDRAGRVLSTDVQVARGVGGDLVLTLDATLQRIAEDLLDQALLRRKILHNKPKEAGGAIVVMDVRSGAILVAAAAPAFDPGAFVDPQRTDEAARLLRDPGKPLFDRISQMALPPGSVFKTLTAVALLEGGVVDSRTTVDCQGYLDSPDRWRCEIFTRTKHGHGPVNLADALARSCNVYFFFHASILGVNPLVDWASRFGFGERSGVDLPRESAGNLPRPETIGEKEGRLWRVDDTMSLAVGQSGLTATPLQIVRMTAAVANGGELVTPHLVQQIDRPGQRRPKPLEHEPPKAIRGLSDSTLAAVRQGLLDAVASPLGTAQTTVYLSSVSIAGKTGTAQTGNALDDHAWFAGYFPAENPKYAFVVVLEHSGDAADAAGPLAQRLVEAIETDQVQF